MNINNISHNPNDHARKKLDFILNKSRPTKRFAHKSYKERYREVDFICTFGSYFIQLTSIVTGFIALSNILAGWPSLLSVIASVFVLSFIEGVKRFSFDDLLQYILQYKKLSVLGLFLGATTMSVSIFISLEGAKLAPNLAVADPVEVYFVEQSDEAIQAEYGQRIAALEQERSTYRDERRWKNRLATKDAKYIQAISQEIKEAYTAKAAALLALQQANQDGQSSVAAAHQQAMAEVATQRAKMGTTFYWGQLILEITFLLLLTITWWYDWNVFKEEEAFKMLATSQNGNQQKKQSTYQETAAVPQKDGSRPAERRQPSHQEAAASRLTNNTLEMRKTAAVSPRPFIGFKQGSSKTPPVPQVKKVEQVELVEKEYTRLCKQCNQGYIHRAGNQKYCSITCKKAAERVRKS